MMSEQARPNQTRPQGSWPPAPRDSDGLSTGALVTGLIVLGATGALLWYYLGADLKRYLKIRSM
jgi:hypothetical protein